MMRPTRALSAAAAAVLLIAFAVVLSPAVSRSDVAHASCDPPRLSWPKWLPKDLPLPRGTYTSRKMKPIYGYHRAKFILPFKTGRFARYILNHWPDAGYEIGRGDSEPNQVEAFFSKGTAIGQFRADDYACKTVLYLIYDPVYP